MVARASHRVLLFFLAAVLLPCGGLVVVAARSLRQERELAEKRAADERNRASKQAWLAIEHRLDAIETAVRRESEVHEGTPSWTYADSSLRLVAEVRNGQLVLPWELHQTSSRVATNGLAAALRAGEREEFTNGDIRAAAASYRTAVDLGARSSQSGEARLALARVSSKLGDGGEVTRQRAALLQLGFDDTDQQGIPHRLYAASAFGRSDPDGSLRALVDAAGSGIDLPPEALYLARQALDTIVATKSDSRTSLLRRLLDDRIRRAEQAVTLRHDFSRLGLVPTPVTATDDRSSRWSLFGREPWFIALSADSMRGRATLVAVDAARVIAEANRSAALDGAVSGRLQLGDLPAASESEENLPWRGVSFIYTAGSRGTSGGFARPVYLGILFVVLGVTLFGAYLLWRDVRRELRVADLRSQFVASVSHELKTPLTAIRMFAETLARATVSDPQAREEYLVTIVNETERLSRLLNNVLDFSRMERGQREYHLRPTALDAVVQRSARTLQYPLSQQGLSLKVKVADDLPLVQADEDALQQAVLNLLTNAMKYSGSSSEIDLTLHRSNSEAIIAVRDHGLGIPPTYRDRVVEKFFRVPSPETAGIPGAGLGLTLVDHIVRGHGGRLEIESLVGSGSTFSIHLPVEQPT
jgi:signal transduction histidine kinase